MPQKQGLTLLEERMVAALDTSLAATMTELEREVSSFAIGCGRSI
ncbi:hypothetical protein [Microbispora hainanensis]